MDRQPIKSSQITSVGYDEQSKTLELEFSSGGIYSYEGVPEDIHAGLLRAVSPGHYFAVCIRANYVCTRHHVTGCEGQDHPNPGDCLCWCHRLVKSEELSHGAVKTESKSIQKRKATQTKVTAQKKVAKGS